MTPDSRLLRSRASIKEYSVFPSRASQWMIVAPVDVSMDARRSLRNAASKGRGLPVAVRDLGDEPASARSPAVEASHVGLGPVGLGSRSRR